MDSTIRVVKKVNAPVQDVWDAWVTPGQLSQWLCPDSNINLEVGGAYELFWDVSNRHSNSTIGCTITELRNHEKLSIEWKGPDIFSNLMNTPGNQTKVEILFTAVGDQTKIELIHSGWGTTPEWEDARQWHIAAWNEGFSELEKYFNNKR